MSRQLIARHSHRAWISNGKLHVWGGCIKGQSAKLEIKQHGKEVQELTQVVEVFDVNGAREWVSVLTKGNDRPFGIRDAALALLGVGDTRAIIFGGYCGFGAACFHNSLHELDTTSWEWHVLAPNAYERFSLAPMMKRNSGAVGFNKDGKDYVCIFAGNGLIGSSQCQDTAGYASVTNKPVDCTTNELHCAEVTGHKARWFWPTATGRAPPPCSEISFLKSSDLEVVMFGGYGKNAKLLDGVYHLNLEDWKWSKVLSSPNISRSRHFSTLLAQGKILTMGGADQMQATRNDMYIIDVESGTIEEVLTETIICKREWHSITTIPATEPEGPVRVAVIGGVTERIFKWDPVTWPKAEANHILEFKLTESESDGERKWTLKQAKEFHEFFCRQDTATEQRRWRLMQSETTNLSDHGYAQLRQDFHSMKLRCSRLELKQETVKIRCSRLEDLQEVLDQQFEDAQESLEQRYHSLEQKYSQLKKEQEEMQQQVTSLQRIVSSMQPASESGPGPTQETSGDAATSTTGFVSRRRSSSAERGRIMGVTTRPGATAQSSTRLDAQDLAKIQGELKKIVDIQGFGLNLGLHFCTIQEIMQRGAQLQQKREIVFHWLQRTNIIDERKDEVPTWDLLSDAIKDESLALANAIRSKYC